LSVVVTSPGNQQPGADALSRFLAATGPTSAATGPGRRPALVLTGAGVSTDSGIPDYRGPDAPARTPMTIGEFRSGPAARQRYWARSHLGWHRMHRATPNTGHRALADLQHRGVVGSLITQNIDGLHQRAGTSRVIDLHGRIDRVICLACHAVSGRADLHARLEAANPGFGDGLDLTHRPDGDVELADTSRFVMVDCPVCGGDLKPDVVFFGENVPPERVAECYRLVEGAAALLVLGSSLTVQSGLRFVRRAHRLGTPVAIVNRGITRGDVFADLKLDAGCSELLTQVVSRIGPAGFRRRAPR
jgi:NAD-dependent SIR2 family protein deacetylase